MLLQGIVWLLVALASPGLSMFLDRKDIIRLKKISQVGTLNSQNDTVVVLFIHNGECTRDGCNDFEDVLINFREESKNLARFFVIDCKDNAKYDNNSVPYFVECFEANLPKLPAVVYFVSPANKLNAKSNKLNPMMRFEHNTTYDVESLKNRLIEIQPSYSFLVQNDESLKLFEDVGRNETKIPRVIYFNPRPKRSLEFKLITQRFRHQAIFAEVYPSADKNVIIGATQEEIELPFVAIQRLGENSVRDLEIHRKSDNFEEMKEAIEKSLDKQDKSIFVLYKVEEVHENIEEIKKMHEEHRKSRVFHIQNMTQLENFISHDEYPVGLYYHFDQENFEKEVFDRLLQYPDIVLLAHLSADLYLQKVREFTNDTKFLEEITQGEKFKNGGLAMLPPGNMTQKMLGMVVFDNLNSTEMMMQVSTRWSGPNLKQLESKKIEVDMLDTITNNKIFVAYITDPQQGLPFEYVMTAVNPRFREMFNFFFYLGTEEKVYRAFNIDKSQLPKLMMVHYNRETYKSREYFSIHPLEDPSKSGFRDYETLMRVILESHKVYSQFLNEANQTLLEVNATSLQAVDAKEFIEDKLVIVLIDDEDIDFETKLDRLKTGFFQNYMRAQFIKTTCYDTLDDMDLDPSEINLVMYNKKKGTVLSAELEELSGKGLKKQLYNLKVGMGKKIALSVFNKYMASKDCSIGNTQQNDGDL